MRMQERHLDIRPTAFIPLWILPTSFSALAAGAFCVQFGVQGAWGVVCRHLHSMRHTPHFSVSDPHSVGGDVTTCLQSYLPRRCVPDWKCESHVLLRSFRYPFVLLSKHYIACVLWSFQTRSWAPTDVLES